MIEPFHMLGREIHVYALLAIIGALCCLWFVYWQIKKCKYAMDDAINMLTYAFIGGALGGKLLYLLQHITELFEYHDVIFADIASFTTYFFSGFIFYGGLIGAIIACIIYVKQFHVDMRHELAVFVCIIPLFHVFGRLGCFLEGCCYGKQMTGIFSMMYHSSLAVPVSAYRFPVQLWEAAGNLILFLVLWYLLQKDKRIYITPAVYCISYAILRFILEFLRGDEIRGIYILSLSQWISLAVCGFGIWILKDKKQHFVQWFSGGHD